jgi:hypothetical protein
MGFKSVGTAQVPLTFDGSSAITNTTPNQNVFVLPNLSAVMFDILVVCRALVTSGGSQGWQITGAAYNDNSAVTLIGTPTVTAFMGVTNMGNVTVKTYSTNAIAVYVTASYSTTISWHAVMRTSELVTTT